ncbi:MAG: HEAT repeat domain-containing protein, partial [Promethearchaeota archaeon]
FVAVKNIRPDLLWTARIIKAFEFPHLIPITAAIIAGFSMFYPLYEYLVLAAPGESGNMEIQQWIEEKIIDRTTPPISHFVAILLYFCLVILPPSITSYVALNFWDIPPNLTPGWTIGLIFFVWILLGPMFYLSYYSKIGAAHSFFRGRRVNRKKDKKTGFWYWVAILTIFSTVWSFIQYAPILWGDFPEPTNPVEAQREFIPIIIDFLRSRDLLTIKTAKNIRLFFTIVPIEFLLFIITTCFFGLLGFYAKFISKEPLNSPKMVLFAAYIICGIAFSIFVDAMVKYPYSFPDEFLNRIGLNLHLSTSREDQEIFIRIFSTAILLVKTLDIIFLTNFLFRRKEIKNQADEWVLNKAILENDFEIIKKYSSQKNSETRLMVAQSVINYIQLKDVLSKESSVSIAGIMEILINDEDPAISGLISKHEGEIIGKLHQDSLLNSLKKMLNSTEKRHNRNAITVLQKISKQNMIHTRILLKEIVASNLSKEGADSLFDFVAEIDNKNHNLTSNLIEPLMIHENENLVYGSLTVIGKNLSNYQAEYSKLQPELSKLLHHSNVEIIAKTIDVFSSLASKKQEHIPDVMTEFNLMTAISPEIIRQRIGALVKFAIVQPQWLNSLFDYLEIYLNHPNPRIVEDAAVSLGSLSSTIESQVFFDRIFPFFRKLVHSEDLNVKKAILSSMVVLTKIREDIAKDDRFQHLFSIYLVDPHVEIRHQVFRFIDEGDPQFILGDIAALLTNPLIKIQVRIDLMNILASMAEKIIPYIDELQLIEILQKQNFEQEKELNIQDMLELQADQSRIFGFQEGVESISLIGATIALFYEILYFAPKYYDQVESFISANLEKGQELAAAKKIEFKCKIVLDELKGIKNHGLNITLEGLLNDLERDVFIVEPLTQKIIAEFLYEVYPIKKEFHKQFFEIYTALCKQRELKDNNLKRILLLGMAKIIAENHLLYFKPMQMKNLIDFKSIKTNPFETCYKPFLLSNMNSTDESIYNGVSKALYIIIEVSEEEKLIRELLIQTISNSKSPNIKISAMKALISLPIQIEDANTINILLKQVKSKNPLVQAEAIRSLGNIIRIFPITSSKSRSKEFKKLKSLIYKVISEPYNPGAPLEIKEAIVEHLPTITLLHPDLKVCLSAIKAIGLDPVPSIATIAVDTFFQLIDFKISDISIEKPKNESQRFESLYGSNIAELKLFRHFANSPLTEVNDMLIRKIISLYERESDKIDIGPILPSLSKLATSSSKDIRSQSIAIFSEIYLKDQKTFGF